MKNLYSTYTTDELWLIKETEFERKLQNIRESQFTLGNGYLGVRGICEEIPYDCHPGTYLSGVYDKMAAQVSELVNLPNPINFKFTIEGEKLDVVAMDVLQHRRVLNMKKALLLRQNLYQDSKGRRYDYQSLRFISQNDKNIGVMRIALTPLDAGCQIDINTGIDTSVSNAGVLSEGRKRHFRIKELGQFKRAGYLVTETLEKKYTVIYWAGFYYHINGKKTVAQDNIFRLKLKKGQSVVFTKVFCTKHFSGRTNSSLQKKSVFQIFRTAFNADFNLLLKRHIAVWEKIWKKSDIVIEGTANLQINLRFNIYHMLICGHHDNGFSSIGARTLSGEGYRGHIFWDAEIFLFPFYLFAFPKIARNMLLYRYRRLAASREIARQNGYRGAQFAWESADTGFDETPEWARNIDRTIIQIETNKLEHHITADIAYAVYKYYLATEDSKFMDDYGYEIIVETARFWTSRTVYNKRKDRQEIKNVIGPDEFHVGVNNNAFTNMMAKWNLITACKLCRELGKKPAVYKKLKNKLNLTEKEIRGWMKTASRISINTDKKGVIEQFDGYFRLKKVIPSETDENGIPLLPLNIKAKDLGKTQLVKQADVLMLLVLLEDVFNPKTKKTNYDFYLPRTVHKSSLSPSMHALAACSVFDLHRAYNFFNVALRADISNLYGNTPEGIHAACLGGTWQVVFSGFAGVTITKNELSINPSIPRSWRKIAFSFSWRASLVKLELTSETVRLRLSGLKRGKGIRLRVFDKPVFLKTNKVYIFKKEAGWHRKEEYY